MNEVDYAVADVLAGIDATAAVGLVPIKVNCVVKCGSNDEQIIKLARHFRASGHILRLIEFMDVGSSNGWKMHEVLPSAKVVARINAEFRLAQAEANYTSEVAERWRYLDGSGEIGVISSVTQAFCSTCTRIRLSTEQALHLPLCAARPRSTGTAAQGQQQRGTGAGDCRNLGRAQRPLFGNTQCRDRSGQAHRDVLHRRSIAPVPLTGPRVSWVNVSSGPMPAAT